MKNFKHIDQDVRANGQKNPSKPVLFHKDKGDGNWKGMTWSDTLLDSEKVSKSLIDFGLEAGDRVGIFSQNSPEWILADIGILSIRAVTVPIYATNSAKEAEYIIQDAEISIVFAGDQVIYDRLISLFGKLSCLKQIVAMQKDIVLSEEVNSVYWDAFLSRAEGVDSKELDKRYASADQGDLASIIYTSGTTGEPKGVMLDHLNFLESFIAHDTDLTTTEDYRSLSILPLSHIYERSWVFFCLHKGMAIYFNEDPKEMANALKEVKPHIMCTVPRMYEKIYAAIQDKKNSSSALLAGIMNWSLAVGDDYYNEHLRLDKKPGLILGLKYKVANALVFKKLRGGFGGDLQFTPCGGAALSGDLVRFFHSFGIRVICGYGLTETTATATLFADKNFDFSSAGRPIYGAEIKIGENQEILVKGPGVMRGYYKKPEATAAVFEGEWFKTGDAGKIDEQGQLTITDRIKDLMKTSGGKYIAPQKLEMALVCDEMIEQIAVIGDQRNFVTALAVPSFINLKNYADKHGISYKSVEDLISNSQIKKMMTKRFDHLQRDFSGFEKIKKFTLLPREFTIEKGEITSTLKLKRKVIQNKYKELIDKMYSSKK